MGDVKKLVLQPRTLKKGDTLQEGVRYRIINGGIIGDNLISPRKVTSIKIHQIIQEKGGYCDMNRNEFPPREESIEIIYEGGIIRTTRDTVLELLLTKSKTDTEVVA